MMLKSSFWDNRTENSKRRPAMWGLSILVFAVMFPILLAISVLMIDVTGYIALYGDSAMSMVTDMVKASCTKYAGLSSVRESFIVGLAIVCGIEGFAYLFDKTKVDFYFGMPTSRKIHFVTTWVNGLLIYLIPSLVGMLINMLIISASGYSAQYSFSSIIVAYIYGLFLYIGVYNVAIIALLVSGNLFATAAMTGFLLAIELLIRLVAEGYASDMFYYHYSYEKAIIPLVNPIGIIGRMRLTMSGERTGLVIGLVAFALLSFVPAMILFLKRPVENAGKMLIYKKLEAPIKIIISVFAAMALGMIVNSIVVSVEVSDYNTSPWYISLLIGLIAIIICAIIQAVFEMDPAAIVHKPFHYLIVAAVSVLIFFGYKYDVFGIDSYIPDAEKVASVAFSPEGYNDKYYVLEDNSVERYITDYVMSHMYITDTATVCDIARESIERSTAAREEINAIPTTDIEAINKKREEMNNEFSTATVLFRLKSGRKVRKIINVPVREKEISDKLAKVIDSDEFKSAFFAECGYDLDKGREKIGRMNKTISLCHGVFSTKISEESLKELMTCYKKDIEDYSYNTVKNEYDLATVEFSLSAISNYDNNEDITYMANARSYDEFFSLNIYPSYKNCVKYLTDKGYLDEITVKAEDVDRITVEYMENDMNVYSQAREYEEPYMFDNENTYTVEYTDPEKIAELLTTIVPGRGYDYRWDRGAGEEDNVRAYITFKEGTRAQKDWGAYNPDMIFMEDLMPEYVETDIKNAM